MSKGVRAMTSMPALLILAVFMLSACAESQFLIHTAKIVSKQGDTESKGHYKVGNPYEISGTWYYPKVDYDYDETGIASWYGPNFHGKLTANGETYDMNALTAAHRTLPLPTWVEVTNLENGRKLNLRINDRGPYAKGRIIDISRKGAQLLGFQTNGVAKVRVRILAEESLALARRLKGEATLGEVGSPITVDSMPATAVDTQTLAPPEGTVVAEASGEMVVEAPIDNTVVAEEIAAPIQLKEPEPVAEPLVPAEPQVQVVQVIDTGIYIQAGAFSQYENASRVHAKLSPIGEVNISQILVNDVDLYRVRLGPIANVTDADTLLGQVMSAGYPHARIIVE
jgi:rare lipoprotein A